MKIIDLRRDTITLPNEEMKEAAFGAHLGDSVYGEDPLQRELEEKAAQVLGKDAAIFLPSGTMGNLVALLTHSRRGEEVILEENAHIRSSETGGAAAVAGLMLRSLSNSSGIPSQEQVNSAVRPDDIHYPRTSLICLETTHYRYGGIVPPLESMAKIYELAQALHITLHLDGARLWNAAVTLGVEPSVIAGYADSVMASLSKGLGAPVGSVLAGSEPFIREACRYRKMLGGGMRQTGWLCACGLIAMQPENIARLEDDHRNARILAEGISLLPGVKVDVDRVHSNFVLADISETPFTSGALVKRLAENGVLVNAVDSRVIRCVTSREVDSEEITIVLETLRSIFNSCSGL